MKNVLLAVFSLFLLSTLASARWVSQTSGTNFSLLDVDFVSQTTGYAVGGPDIGLPSFPEGIILKTNNSGETWTQLIPPGDHQMSGICLINSTYGWMVGAEHIYKTVNGGETWTEQSYNISLIGSNRGFFHDVACIDANTAYAVGFNGVIVKTENGLTWNQQYGDWRGGSPALFSISCTDSGTCWTVGYSGTVLHTINGGTSWTAQNSQTNLGLNAVYFLNSERGWLSGGVAPATTRRTSNGGETWENLTIDDAVALRALYFVNLTHGWAVGNNVIRFTNNSGNNWYEEWADISFSGGISNLPVIMRGVDFPAENVGWAVGDDGVILRLGVASSEPSGRGNLSIRYPNFTVYAANRTQVCQSDLDECVDNINRTCTFVASLPTEEQVVECRAREESECNDSYAACLESGEAGSEADQEAQAEQTGQEEAQQAQQMQSSFNPVQSVVAVFQSVVNWFAALFGG